MVCRFFVRVFDEDAEEVFRAARTEEHATFAEFFFDLARIEEKGGIVGDAFVGDGKVTARLPRSPTPSVARFLEE